MAALALTRHTEATRKVILDGAVALFLQRKRDDFSIQEVADQSGLTHRTVYRYFPTRQELLLATAHHLAAHVGEEHEPEPLSLRDWLDVLPAHFARVEANLEILRSILAAALASGDRQLFGQDIRERDRNRWEAFRRELPRLPERDAKRTFATLRQLTSSASYIFYRLRFELSPKETTHAIRDAANEIVAQARRRERSATRKGGRER